MLVTNHVLVGAAIGAVVRRPVPAYLLGVVSHFVCDALPHWGDPRLSGRERSADFLKIAVRDGLTGLAVLGGLAARTPASHRAAVLAGALGAATPDADKPSRVAFGRSPWPAAVDAFHTRIQREHPSRMPQETVMTLTGVALAAFLLRRARPARA
jgi:hypothetical protein